MVTQEARSGLSAWTTAELPAAPRPTGLGWIAVVGVLLKLGANTAGVILAVSSLHLLYINTRLLPPHVRPPLWRRAALVATAIFYGGFVALSISAVW